MKAAQINQYGGPEVINLVEVDKPQPGPGQVLVEVHAASISPFDTTVREGRASSMIKSLPITLGGDIAGVVVSGAGGFREGDRVYGAANVVAGNSGAFAEFAATSQDQLAAMPNNVSFIEAASLPLVGLSALQVIGDQIGLKPRQKILIHGGAGGIGTVALQLAKHIGAHVAATASGEGLAYVKKLGADEVIDYKNQDFSEILSDYDAVLDTVAGETYKKSFKVLKKGGVIVSMLSRPDEELMNKHQVRAVAQQTRTTTEALNELSALIEKGVITPHVGQVFSLDRVQEAASARESGQITGKVVLKIK